MDEVVLNYGNYKHPEWSFEGWVERYGEAGANKIMQGAIQSIIEPCAASVDYEEYLKSTAWKMRASDAKRRAGHRCQVCHSADRLEAHHRTYERLGHEDHADITVLCHECHELFSKNGKLKR